MGELRERIIEAHGGRSRWDSVERVMASLAMGGMAFMPYIHPFRDVEVSITPQQGLVSLAPFPGPGRTGYVDGHRLWIETEAREVVTSRNVPGLSARTLRYWSLWDELDRLYVVALTVWHALAFPWLLAQEGVEDEPVGAVTMSGHGRMSRLEVAFAVDRMLPSPKQTLYADSTGLIRRMDFVPSAYGGWLRVGQILSGFEAVNGVVIPTEQTLYPCLINNQLWRGNRFLWLTLADPMIAYRR
jgi:hypothetical protein